MATADKPDKPTGRAQVVAAMLEHAADLFAERGPAATSTREIAARAGINQALIFRHFGSKEQLVGAVLDDLAAQAVAARHADTAAAGTDGPNIEGMLAGVLPPGYPEEEASVRAINSKHRQVLARALLDGYPVGRLQRQFPGVSELIEVTRARIDDDTDARLAAASVVALVLGWQMFGPFIRSAATVDDVPYGRIRQAIETAITGILDSAGHDAGQHSDPDAEPTARGSIDQ
ncbi:helix-turn-helix domain-containing protein [Nocardia sp. 004]|uniref:TetR/AcrR family transcriptional regulator n=1 Tax=Nocardia sp. 004 TaxID=3385978 RepID=UPI0039A1CB09